MFDWDICRCMTVDCPKYEKCYRGNGHDYRPGIYSYSLLGEVCNEKSGYSNFIEGDKVCED